MTTAHNIQVGLDAGLQYLGPAATRELSPPRSDTLIPNISVTSDLRSLEDEWRGFECHADCTPFQTFDWLANWQRCIGAQLSVTPVIVLARKQSGELLFILPLAIERMQYGRSLTFLGHALCDYNAPLLAPEMTHSLTASAFVNLWKTIHEKIRLEYPHDIVVFDKMPAVVGEQSNPMLAFPTMLNPSGAHATGLQTDWEQFYSQKRSAATRRNDRKKLKKLAEFGSVEFITPDEREDIQGLLGTLVAQKSHKFRQMGVSDLFAKPGYAEFFTSVAIDARALVHVSALQVGSAAAAVNLGLMFRGCYYHILASYDDGPAARFGPGAAHLHELLRHAIVSDCTRFDFTIGDEAYKLDWSDTKLDLYDYVSGVGLFGYLCAAFMAVTLRLKRFIKTSPVIWNLVRKLRAALPR